MHPVSENDSNEQAASRVAFWLAVGSGLVFSLACLVAVSSSLAGAGFLHTHTVNWAKGLREGSLRQARMIWEVSPSALAPAHVYLLEKSCVAEAQTRVAAESLSREGYAETAFYLGSFLFGRDAPRDRYLDLDRIDQLVRACKSLPFTTLAHTLSRDMAREPANRSLQAIWRQPIDQLTNTSSEGSGGALKASDRFWGAYKALYGCSFNRPHGARDRC